MLTSEAVGSASPLQRSGRDHSAEPVGEECCQLVKASEARVRADVVEFGERVGERSERAAAAALALCLGGDDGVAPAADVVPARERVELRLVEGEDAHALPFDDGVDEIVFVGEVVVELRLAGRGRVADVVEGDRRHPRS